ncbi:MAG: hypothetical protein HOD72_14885 [Opitutae bacterium]|jgi:hypothetical protein|nr:hypothetical protein [Opitutae bacterium]MBT4225738.1 hypothetical protein [Opitutae bacterium]MBT5379744.1 hypothetical protein [Opitutae bacterium]MBT5689628.1 hypothetical protein [Opitutae bacterium]MBT6461253.1 hypothetical protein [Opitutae bacterium]
MSEIDPIENTDRYIKIQSRLREDIQQALENDGLPGNPLKRGLCHLYWMYKKQILLEKYGINWRSPSDLTPHVVFD